MFTEEHEKLIKELTDKFDKIFAEEIKLDDNTQALIFSDIVKHSKFELTEAFEIIETHLKENYINKDEYKHFKFRLNSICDLRITTKSFESKSEVKAHGYNEDLIKYLRALFNEKVDNYKLEQYKGTINVKSDVDKEIYDKYIVPYRKDVEKVNEGQYKLIYDDKPVNKLNFEIKPNKPFYEDSEELKDKKSLKRFLTESNKVHINPDMFFIPFRYKQRDDKFYILVINNILENIELYQLNSLNHLNKQHNLYYVIETNMDGKFEGKLNEFKNYILRSCQKSTNGNRDLLSEVYSRISHFKDDKFIVKQYH
jgi:hypothetical protein